MRAFAARLLVAACLGATAPGFAAEAPAGHDAHGAHAEHGDTAPSASVTPVPPVTDEMRRAASAEVGDMREHMSDDRIHHFLLVDRLEHQGGDGDDMIAWDLKAWIGRDFNRLWIRSEGERTPEGTEESAVEVLWGRPVSRWWDVVAGLRRDFDPGDGRNWLGAGVIGTAPYRFDVQATVYVGEAGATALQGEAEYDLLLTDRLILQPRAELTAYGKTDERRGLGSGLSSMRAGLRLRYELRREFAPYVGVEWTDSFGPTADLRRRGGEPPDALHYVAGLRFWF